MNCDWFYSTVYVVYLDGTKTKKRSPPDNLTPWITIQSASFKRKGTEEIINPYELMSI